jgi:hypothetical protein
LVVVALPMASASISDLPLRPTAVLLASTTVEVVLPVVSASNFHHASSLLDVAPYLFSLMADYWKPIQKNVSSAETSVESSVQ